MPNLVLYDIDIGTVMQRRLPNPSIGMDHVFGRHPFRVDLNTSDAQQKAFSDNQRVIGDIYEAVKPIYLSLIEALTIQAVLMNERLAIVGVLDLIERNPLPEPMGHLALTRQTLNAAWDAEFQKRSDAARADMLTAAHIVLDQATRSWNAAVHTKTTYQHQEAVNLGLSLGAVAVNAVAASGSGGLSLVLALLGMAKTLAKIGLQLHALWKDIDDVMQRMESFASQLREDCKTITKSGEFHSGLVHTKHLVFDALNEATGGLSQNAWLLKLVPASKGQFESDLHYFSGKLSRLKVNMEDANRLINEFIDQQQAYDLAQDHRAQRAAQAVLLDEKMKQVITKTHELIEQQIFTYQRLMGEYRFDRTTGIGQRSLTGQVSREVTTRGWSGLGAKRVEVQTKYAGLEDMERRYTELLQQVEKSETGKKAWAIGTVRLVIGLADTIVGVTTTVVVDPIQAEDLYTCVGEAAIELVKYVNDSLPLQSTPA